MLAASFNVGAVSAFGERGSFIVIGQLRRVLLDLVVGVEAVEFGSPTKDAEWAVPFKENLVAVFLAPASDQGSVLFRPVRVAREASLGVFLAEKYVAYFVSRKWVQFDEKVVGLGGWFVHGFHSSPISGRGSGGSGRTT